MILDYVRLMKEGVRQVGYRRLIPANHVYALGHREICLRVSMRTHMHMHTHTHTSSL